MIDIIVLLVFLFLCFISFCCLVINFDKKLSELKKEIDNLNINNNTDENNIEEICENCEIIEQFYSFLIEILEKIENDKIDDVKVDIKNVLTMMENSEEE